MPKFWHRVACPGKHVNTYDANSGKPLREISFTKEYLQGVAESGNRIIAKGGLIPVTPGHFQPERPDDPNAPMDPKAPRPTLGLPLTRDASLSEQDGLRDFVTDATPDWDYRSVEGFVTEWSYGREGDDWLWAQLETTDEKAPTFNNQARASSIGIVPALPIPGEETPIQHAPIHLALTNRPTIWGQGGFIPVESADNALAEGHELVLMELSVSNKDGRDVLSTRPVHRSLLMAQTPAKPAAPPKGAGVPDLKDRTDPEAVTPTAPVQDPSSPDKEPPTGETPFAEGENLPEEMGGEEESNAPPLSMSSEGDNPDTSLVKYQDAVRALIEAVNNSGKYTIEEDPQDLLVTIHQLIALFKNESGLDDTEPMGPPPQEAEPAPNAPVLMSKLSEDAQAVLKGMLSPFQKNLRDQAQTLVEQGRISKDYLDNTIEPMIAGIDAYPVLMSQEGLVFDEEGKVKTETTPVEIVLAALAAAPAPTVTNPNPSTTQTLDPPSFDGPANPEDEMDARAREAAKEDYKRFHFQPGVVRTGV